MVGRSGRRAGPALVGLVVGVVSLAGCADGALGPATADEALTQGYGGIAGLLVDDRFRPLELTTGRGGTEFQAEGFILIQETGDQLRTTPNGEFRSPPLAPGRYMLRFTIAGHEANPQSVEVSAGAVAETTVVARRVVSTTDLIIQQEYGVFIDCILGYVIWGERPGGSTFGCVPDLSPDTARNHFYLDVAEGGIESEATFMVSEILFDNPAGPGAQGTYRLRVAGFEPDVVGFIPTYALLDILEGDYARIFLQRYVESDIRDDAYHEYVTWQEPTQLMWSVFGNGQFYGELKDVADPALGAAGLAVGGGIGAQLGIKGRLLVSLFFTDDASIPESFCGFCGDVN